MELTEKIRTRPGTDSKPTEAEFDASFKPRGAIAFFLLLVLLSLATWYGIYFLMLQRG
ncbi:cytochrome c oxidase subunit 2A [Flaviaesturariibacter amylovorans]